MRPGSMNGYSYGLGNPVNLTDPSGQAVRWPCWTLVWDPVTKQLKLVSCEKVSTLPPIFGTTTTMSTGNPASDALQILLVYGAYCVGQLMQQEIQTQTKTWTWQDILALPMAQPFQAPLPTPDPKRDPGPLPIPVPTAPPIPTAQPTPSPTPCFLPSGQYPAIPVVSLQNLLACRPEASATIGAIMANGPFPFPQDNGPYFNDPPFLHPPSDPFRRTPTGYREYTVVTPGAPSRADRRIVTFGNVSRLANQFTEMYYTDNHYTTFTQIQ